MKIVADKIMVLLQEIMDECTSDNLNDIIVYMLKQHTFTSKDSLQNLIDLLENLKEEL